MKITKTQLQNLIREELEKVMEDETMSDHPINAVGFLPDHILDAKIEHWLDDLRGPAIEAAEAGDKRAQKFLDRIAAIGSKEIKKGLFQAMGLGRSRGKEQSLARSFEKDFYSDEEGLEENLYGPGGPDAGDYYDQPKTSNMQLARQCKEGDQAACEMLKKRLGKK